MARHQKKAGLLDPNSLPREVARAERGIETRFKDGGGLSLLVTTTGTAKWVHRFPGPGPRLPEMWLGRYPRRWHYPRYGARDRNDKLILAGINPLEARQAGADLTFGEFATKFRSRLAPPQQRPADVHSEWLIDMTRRVGALAKIKIQRGQVRRHRLRNGAMLGRQRPRPAGSGSVGDLQGHRILA